MSEPDPHDSRSRGTRLGLRQNLGQRIVLFFLVETLVGRLALLMMLATMSAVLLRVVIVGEATIGVFVMAVVFCGITGYAASLIWSARGRPPQQPDSLLDTPLGHGVLTAIMMTASFFAGLAAATLGDPIIWVFAAGLSAITLLSIRIAWRAMDDADEESR